MSGGETGGSMPTSTPVEAWTTGLCASTESAAPVPAGSTVAVAPADVPTSGTFADAAIPRPPLLEGPDVSVALTETSPGASMPMPAATAAGATRRPTSPRAARPQRPVGRVRNVLVLPSKTGMRPFIGTYVPILEREVRDDRAPLRS
jgi:hypothetical protein